MKIETKPVEKMRLLGLEHKGPYNEIGPVFGKLHETAAGAGIPMGMMAGIYYDNPQEVAPADLRSKACIVVPDDFSGDTAGLIEDHVGEGNMVVAEFLGSYEGLPEAWQNTMGWMESNNVEAEWTRDCFELYLHHDEEDPSKCVTHICIPCK